MKLGVVFMINAALALAFGAGFLVAPAMIGAQYGLSLDAGGIQVTRLLGACYVGFGLLAWLLRSAAESQALRAAVTSLAVANTIATVVALVGILTGATNELARA